jgi:hypothetical protein
VSECGSFKGYEYAYGILFSRLFDLPAGCKALIDDARIVLATQFKEIRIFQSPLVALHTTVSVWMSYMTFCTILISR